MLKRSKKRVEKNEINRITAREIDDIVKDYGIVIESSAYLHGEYDWMVTCAAPDVKEAKKFVDKMNEKTPTLLKRLCSYKDCSSL